MSNMPEGLSTNLLADDMATLKSTEGHGNVTFNETSLERAGSEVSSVASCSLSRRRVTSSESIMVFMEAASVSEMGHEINSGEASDGFKDRRHTVRMTPCEEYANAASMLGPFLTCLSYLLWHPNASPSVWLCFFGQAVHMPFSMTYHIQMALQRDVDPVDNAWRVLDQTFILLAAGFWALGLSGALWYGLVNGGLSCLYICWLWQDLQDVKNGRSQDPSRGGVPGRRHSMLLIVVLYLGPIFARGDFINAISSLVCFACAASLFITYPLGGYSHAAFHVVLAPYQWFVLRAADKVRSIGMFPFSEAYEFGLLSILVICVVVRHILVPYKTEVQVL